MLSEYEGVGSVQCPSIPFKSRNASGNLNVSGKGVRMSEAGSSGTWKAAEAMRIRRRRSRLILSDSESSGELLSDHVGFNFDKKNRPEDVKREVLSGWSDNPERGIKKSRLDLFDFNEYNGIDGGNIGNEEEVGKNSETEPDRPFAVYRRRHSSDDSSRKSNSKFEVIADEASRFPGKNSVLKVTSDKKNKAGGPVSNVDGDFLKSKSPARPLSYPEKKIPEKSISVAKTEQCWSGVQNTVPAKGSQVHAYDLDDDDASSKPEAEKTKPCGPIKSVAVTASPTNIFPTRSKEGKVKHGNMTEKQLLRERIKEMLISAGWSIDYRPRSNRDYSDAVYINPAGRGYWSIIKAHHAFQKQLVDGVSRFKSNGKCSPFTPISEEVLSKLTRQTQKKMEKVKKKKQRVSETAGRGFRTTNHLMVDNDCSDKEDKLSYFMSQSGKSLKVGLREVDYLDGGNSANNICKGASLQDGAFASSSHPMLGRKGREIGRCTLLVCKSNQGQNSETDTLVPCTNRRTLLSWMIDSGTLKLSEKVQYMNSKRTRAMLEGWITRDGIHCKCCSKIITVSKFEIHAGSNLRQPFQNIYLESGISLLQCQLEAWNRQKKSARSGFHFVGLDGDDPSDDTCRICGDGGDLICCDSCPSTFHLSCLHIQMPPSGDWHCPNCSCKFCGVNNKMHSQGNDTTAEEPLLKCRLCEKKHHDSCISTTGNLHLLSSMLPTSFCGPKCKELYEHLQKLLGVKHELEAGFSWTLIQRTDPDVDKSIKSFPQWVECNSKLAVALSIMDECFFPIVDRRSGINLIHNVLYNFGSNFSRLDYSGFYTVILEKGDEIISAASLRIHGTQLAEMPFIGTRHIYRRRGMCRRLFFAIESALISLKVEKLIIPAISDLIHTWTVVFGFSPVEKSQKQEMRSLNMLVFLDTDMLQKVLIEPCSDDGKPGESLAAESAPDEKLLPPADTVFDCALEGTSQSPANNEGEYTSERDLNAHVLYQITAVSTGSAETDQNAAPVSTISSAAHVDETDRNAISVSACTVDETMVQPSLDLHHQNTLVDEDKSRSQDSCEESACTTGK